MRKVTVITFLPLSLFLLLQISFWYYAKKFSPTFSMLPSLPSQNEVNLLSFGDPQAYFRFYAMQIQNAGDSFGRFSALKDYDFDVLEKWMMLLDELDSTSHFIPSLASYYYSNTQRSEDTIHVIRYLVQHAERDLDQKWWWLVQAIMIAETKLKDSDLALTLSYKLSQDPNNSYPIWARNMPAIVLLNNGKPDLAEKLATQVVKDIDNISEKDMVYMSYFLKQMIKDVDKKKKK